MTGVTLTGRLICKDEEEAARVVSALPAHIAATRAEAGCVSFDVSQSDDPLIWNVSEAFTDSAAFTAHQSRTAGSDWAKETAGIARDYTIVGLE